MPRGCIEAFIWLVTAPLEWLFDKIEVSWNEAARKRRRRKILEQDKAYDPYEGEDLTGTK